MEQANIVYALRKDLRQYLQLSCIRPWNLGNPSIEEVEHE
jgi:hypothetical protein